MRAQIFVGYYSSRNNEKMLTGHLLLPLILYILTFFLNTPFTNAAQSITPNDVYAKIDLVTRQIDVLLDHKKIDSDFVIKSHEKKLGPMHAYQMGVACIEGMRILEIAAGVRPLPKVVATPMAYKPADVYLITKMLEEHTPKLAHSQGIYDLPDRSTSFSGKTPTDVFNSFLTLFAKLNLLAGRNKITPNEVYSQVVRAVADVKSILTRIDGYLRYRIDAPVSPKDMTPAQVFQECLKTRRKINKLREHYKLSTTPVPNIDTSQKLQPTDVFLQTQLIIAELNLLKMGTHTISATPLAIPVTGMTPSDVHQQVVLVHFLLDQIVPLENMMAQIKAHQ